MKFGVPWSVKGIRPEARETAREAARRSGMSLGEWLNATILHQAAQDDDDSPDHGYDDEDEGEIAAVHQRLDELTKRIEKFGRTGPAVHVQKRSRRESQDSRNHAESQSQNQIAELIARLDRRLEQVVNNAAPVAPPLVPAMPPQAYVAQYAPAPVIPPPLPYVPPQVQAPQPAPQAPPHPLRSPQAYAPRAYAPPPPLPSYAPPKAPTVAMPPSLERAIAEIAARQRTLNDQGKPARPMTQARMPEPEPALEMPQPAMAAAPVPPSPVFAPVPTQDLSGLEDQLRKITNQIETLRRPGVEEAINALRAELGEIGNALTEAMPRHVIDTIENQIAGLSQRIAEGRQAGVDAGALSGIELGLAEVRDALRGLTPAENLVGFNEAVNALAHKIDLIVAQKDPATLQQLEHAITTLREMAGNVASDAAVNGIAAQVQMLAERVEQIAAASGASDALNSLEHRISALADALEQRARSGDTVPPMLEALVGSLSDKIELIQQSRGGDNVAFDHLEDRIVKLVERLDASDSRLGHLEAIERGLADLLVHMQEMRANKEPSGLRAENSGVVELKHDIARTHDVLDALRGTLGHVVDRLGSIEKDIRGDGRARQAFDDEDGSIRMPVGKVAARVVQEAPPEPAPRPTVQAYTQAQTQALAQAAQALAQAQYQPAPPQQAAPPPPPAPQAPPQPHQPAQRRLPPAGRMPLNPDLPPDQPLEPGSGPPQVRVNPAARIADSEAALGGTGPQGSDATASKSGFIAAARRAAKAAVETAPAARAARIEPAELIDIDAYEDAASPSLRGRITKRVKSLFIAASIVAVVVGSVHIAGNIIGFGNSGKTGVETASAPASEPDSTDAAETAAEPAKADAANRGTSTPDPARPDPSWANSLLQPPPAPGATPTAASVAQTPPAATPRPIQAYPSLLSPPALNTPPQTAAADVTGSIGQPSTTAARPASPVAADLPSARPSAGTLTAAIGGPRLRSAAAAGDAAAAHEVAVRFAEGRGVPVSLQEAAFWFERASSKGLAPAQFRYASMLEKGQGVKKDLAHARRLYVAAAGNGNAKAMHNLAVLYAEGIEGKPDYRTAAQWFRKAALRGVADSQFNLGVLAARGLGTEKNLLDAYKWFALAANQGDREAVKKRDELAVHLDATTLAAAAQDVKAFVAEPQPPEATTVSEPKGGWDNATATPATQNRPRPGMPMALGALETKKK